MLRFQEIATKKPFARRRLNTIVARRSSALLTAPSVAKKLFWPFIGQFAAIFFGKKCRVSGNYVKKWTALPKRKAADISTERLCGCRIAFTDADMETIATLVRVLVKYTERRETAQSRGFEYMFGSILKTSQK